MNYGLENFDDLIEINQNQPLSEYVVVFEDAIPKDLCDSTIKQLEKIKNWAGKIKYEYPNQDNDLRYENNPLKSLAGNKLKLDFLTKQWDVSFFNQRSANPTTHPFENIIYEYLYLYSTQMFKNDWYGAWFNFTQARMNKYEEGMFMEKHCDHFRTPFDGAWKGVPVYSVIGMLNDNYEGGDLVFWDDEVINKKTGNLIIFPSNFLFPHRVTPVKNNVRYTFSSYAY